MMDKISFQASSSSKNEVYISIEGGSKSVQGRKIGRADNLIISTLAKITGLFSSVVRVRTDEGVFLYQISKKDKKNLESEYNKIKQKKFRHHTEQKKVEKTLQQDQRILKGPLLQKIQDLIQIGKELLQENLSPADLKKEFSTKLNAIKFILDHVDTPLFQPVKKSVFKYMQHLENREALKIFINELEKEETRLSQFKPKT